ncbi:RING finger domain protein [Sporothrix schenckii 1099-18]|uniref:RING-type domain-containing protein n=2 Tax=Sporothrix schenckii TaxID=29908 RepID=U7PWL3_SPOS1|nr:RING finger domain protein [Sporothrix schenckii 1099-18]ERT00029.1 hypothetical protein HMPREF1624_03398 [Sporothrix schenckii ATCC 58251]KJR85546.1 RING finger domain protein [Sporothrix schenckii 1099-18]
MPSWKWLLTATSATISAVAADINSSSDATIFSMDSVPEWQQSSAMSLQVSDPDADILPISFTVVPLTAVLGLNQSQETRGSVNIRGNLIEATESNYANISANQIAYLNCDNTTNSFIDANRIFNALMGNLPAAILLYSQVGNCCGLTGSNLAYQTIFTMVDMGEAAQALNITNNGDGVAQAVISGNTTSTDGGGGGGSGSNSAVAMSILYSITGLITLLFLVIIATGAVRAHRNPERYGPRSGYGGRPRQSRAKGLARAMLETLPIVKFGDDTPAKPDPSIELESSPESVHSRNPNDVQAHHLSTIPEDEVSQPKTTGVLGSAPGVNAGAGSSAGVGAAAGTANAANASKDVGKAAEGEYGDHLGCSICTEDFEVGEDVRVLPCNHKYHPTCVDPWLINVSGTCPLCRLDLRPNDGETDASTVDGEAPMPPPLNPDAGAAESSNDTTATGNRRRATRIFDLHRLRHATGEERIEALRRFRIENQAENSADGSAAATATTGNGDEANRERLAKRLRDKFRIRTRAQEPSSSSSN